jgi:hypothetical protein
MVGMPILIAVVRILRVLRSWNPLKLWCDSAVGLELVEKYVAAAIGVMVVKNANINLWLRLQMDML